VTRLHTGWRLLLGCFAVARAVPVLLVPGLVHALASLAFAAAFLIAVRGDEQFRPETAALALGLLAAAAVVGTLAAAVVVAMTTQAMKGLPAGMRDGVRIVVPHLPTLLVWSLLNATVGAAFRVMEERVGRWFSWAAAGLFTLATLLVVPVIVLEGGSVRHALRRSVALFRGGWGEAAVSRGGIEVVLMIGWTAAVVLFVLPLTLIGMTPAIVAAVVLLAVYFAVGSTTSAILSAALHRYATDGDSGPFGDLANLFVPRGPQYQPSYAAPHGQWDAS
jgi:hypothetical protein